LIAVSYDDFQTELHPISRGTGDFIAISEIRGLEVINRLASGADTFSENPDGVHDFEQLHIQSPGIAI